VVSRERGVLGFVSVICDDAVVAANAARNTTNERNEQLIAGSVNHAGCRYNRAPCGKHSSSSSC
jgi:hypothetical protein